MISIRVRYYGPTTFRGAKLVATDGRKHLRVAYQYGDDAAEKFAAANEFRRLFLKHSPELEPIPDDFGGDQFYHFKPKADLQKLDEKISQILQHYNLDNKFQTYTLNGEQLVTILTRALLT